MSWFVPLRCGGEQVAGLAIEHVADRLERRETDRARLARLQDRQIGNADIDAGGEFGQRHPPIVEQFVEPDLDRHQIVIAGSSRIAAPRSNIWARTKVISTAIQPPMLGDHPTKSMCNAWNQAAKPPSERSSSCSASRIHAIERRRAALVATNGSPATVARIASRPRKMRWTGIVPMIPRMRSERSARRMSGTSAPAPYLAARCAVSISANQKDAEIATTKPVAAIRLAAMKPSSVTRATLGTMALAAMKNQYRLSIKYISINDMF